MADNDRTGDSGFSKSLPDCIGYISGTTVPVGRGRPVASLKAHHCNYVHIIVSLSFSVPHVFAYLHQKHIIVIISTK